MFDMSDHTGGHRANGIWTLAVYVLERADEKQAAALGAIFGGGEGGPMAAFAPMVGKHLGVKKVPIKYSINGKTRSVEIPDIMHLAVEPLPSAHPSGETWGNWFADHGMRWDNSGKNGHYAPINWSN